MTISIQNLKNCIYTIDKEIQLAPRLFQFEGKVIYSKDAREHFKITAQDRPQLKNRLESYIKAITMEPEIEIMTREVIDQCKEKYGDITISRIKEKIKNLKSYFFTYSDSPRIIEKVQSELFNLSIYLDYKKEMI